MRVRDKEYQSLGVKELLQLCEDNPNDSILGAEIRSIVREYKRINQDWRKVRIDGWDDADKE